MEARTRTTAVLGRRIPTVLVALGVVVGTLALTASSAFAANFTWSGTAAAGESKWSNGTNWEGGVAPSGPVGILNFPELVSPACSVKPPTLACYESVNDLSGLMAEGISVTYSQHEPFYSIRGNPITLGAAGITVKAPAKETGESFFNLSMELILGAPQTWSISGLGKASYSVLTLDEPVTGAQSLQVNLSHSARLELGGVEVGALKLVGETGGDSGTLAHENGVVRSGTLDSADTKPVELVDAALAPREFSSALDVGPLTSVGGALVVGNPQALEFNVHGALTLDGASATQFVINAAGTAAGTDYSQLTATGPIKLAGTLGVEAIEYKGGSVCPALHVGDVDTLITTTGGISGGFAGVPNGADVPIGSITVEGYESVHPRCATARINYTANSVTATIVSVTPPPRNSAPPAISGSTWVGQTLTDVRGSWISEAEPGGYESAFPQWMRCDAAGNACTPIAEAFEPSYTLTSADVGHTIRVVESFFNVVGTTRATSNPTGLVTTTKPEEEVKAKVAIPLPLPLCCAPSVPGPLLSQRETVTATAGTVTIRAKGSSKFVALSGSTSIPDGSEVEATNGRVIITVATAKGSTATAEVYGGRFRVHQEQSGKTVFILTLPLTGCPRVTLPRGSAAMAASHTKHSSGPKSRHLWVSEKGGSWGTNGRYVSTSVQGTIWLTLDECSRSQVKVTAGRVKVHDLLRNKTKTISAGKRYIASKSPKRHK